MKPTLPDLQQRIQSSLLGRYPEIHHVQLYRNTDDGLVLWLTVPWPVPEYLWVEMARFTRDVETLLPIVAVQVNELTPQPVATIQRLEPDAWIEPPTASELANRAAERALLLELALLVRTLIEVSREGVYISVRVRQAGRLPGDPPLQVDEMLGHTVAEIAGQSAHDKIVEVVQKAIAEERTIVFGYSSQFRGEDTQRQFQATCVPKPDGSGAFLAIARIG